MANGVVQELHIERTASRGIVGNIYMGSVARVLPGMQSAFIEIGLERAAFLHVADIWEERQNGESAATTRPIERILAEGQPIMVQVVKDPIGTKGARLSTQISIAGRLLVYLPQDSHIGISQRIEDESGRKLLREKLQQLLAPDERGGYIIRTVAESASDAELANDVAYSRRLWGYIRERAQTSHAPALLHQDLVARAARAARLRPRGHDARADRLAREFRAPAGVRDRLRAEGAAEDRALRRRAAALRPPQRRGGDREGARAPRRAEERRLPDRRPDRGDDDDRRQHRRVRGAAQLRRHHLQDQPGSGAGDRAAAAPAQPRRHHRPRLHRHGERGPPRGGARRVPEGARARPGENDAERVHPARPGRDDAQAHARIARARAVRAVRDLLRARAS